MWLVPDIQEPSSGRAGTKKKENLRIEIVVSRLPAMSWNFLLALCGLFCLPHIEQVIEANRINPLGFECNRDFSILTGFCNKW